jgi:hypothetical protein
MRVEQGVGPMGLRELGVGDRGGPPAVVRLAGELEYPTRHRHRNPLGSELVHERVKL